MPKIIFQPLMIANPARRNSRLTVIFLLLSDGYVTSLHCSTMNDLYVSKSSRYYCCNFHYIGSISNNINSLGGCWKIGHIITILINHVPRYLYTWITI